MAAKKQFSENFKKKIVDEYKKGELSLEEMAGKYGIPAALIQDWVNKERIDNYIINVVSKTGNGLNLDAKANAKINTLLQKIKANGWLLACCLPLAAFLIVSLSFNKRILESEWDDNRQIIEEKLDTLIAVNNELNENMLKLGHRLEKIDNEIELKPQPSVTINNDKRKQSTHKTKITKKTEVKVKVDEKVEVNYSVKVDNDSVSITKPGVFSDSCCCRCNKNTQR